MPKVIQRRVKNVISHLPITVKSQVSTFGEHTKGLFNYLFLIFLFILLFFIFEH